MAANFQAFLEKTDMYQGHINYEYQLSDEGNGRKMYEETCCACTNMQLNIGKAEIIIGVKIFGKRIRISILHFNLQFFTLDPGFWKYSELTSSQVIHSYKYLGYA